MGEIARRTAKTVTNADGSVTNITYHTAGGSPLGESRITTLNGETVSTVEIQYVYDASGTAYGISAFVTDAENNTTQYNYYYMHNLQGDVIGLWHQYLGPVCYYTYDAWGKLLSVTDVSGNAITDQNHIAHINPIRYRGYYYDTETGLYYVSSRYYDPEIGRWISPEPNAYAGAFDNGSGVCGYNAYAYCANNPVVFSDPTGEFLFTAFIVCAVVGAVSGAAIGGTAAYNSAKASGLKGKDLLCATLSGIGKGALVGTVAGGLVGATGGVVAVYGATSVAGTAMLTATATMGAKAVEVVSLQAKKSSNEGDGGWQIVNDSIDSLVDNGAKVLSPAATKTVTTSSKYAAGNLVKHTVVPRTVKQYLEGTGRRVFPYLLVGYAWAHTTSSIFCEDPISRANYRGYRLR